MTNKQEFWVEEFKNMGALWHFNGQGVHAEYEMADRHSDQYFNTDIVLSSPYIAKKIAKELLARVSREYVEKRPWIISYVSSVSTSLILATIVSQLSNLPLCYFDLRNNIKIMDAYPNIKEGDNYLIVTDDIHSGGSLRKLLSLITHFNGNACNSILTIGNFSGNNQLDGIKIEALFSTNLKSWSITDCPLCKNGSLAVPARRQWRLLSSN